MIRKLAVLATLGFALAAFGCATTPEMKTKTGQVVTPETKVKCPKCGATFTIEEGLLGPSPGGSR